MNIKKILKGLILSFLLIQILAPIPAAMADVILVPVHITGQIHISREDFEYISITAYNEINNAEQSLYPTTDSASYDLTVNVPSGTTQTFSVKAYVAGGNDLFAGNNYTIFPPQQISVSADTVNTLNFIIEEPNYVDGTVTLSGSGTLSIIELYGNPKSNNGYQHYTYAYPSERRESATAINYHFPTIPGSIICQGDAYLTNGTRIVLPAQVAREGPNGINRCDYNIDTPETGTIEGSIEHTGIAIPNQAYISSSGPTSRSWLIRNPSNPDNYTLPDLSVGNYSIFGHTYFNRSNIYFSFPYSAYIPSRATSIASGNYKIININACQAYINGRVTFKGSASIDDLKNGYLYANGIYGSDSYGGSGYNYMDLTNGDYSLILSPGDWQVASSLNLSFYRPVTDTDGYLYEMLFLYNNVDNNAENAKPITLADCAVTENKDFSYHMGKVIVKFSIDGGGVFSDPVLSSGKCVEQDESGTTLYNYDIYATGEPRGNVTEGSVTFVAPQASCSNIQAKAMVGGSMTTFGTLAIDVIGGGDVVIHTGGPGIAVTYPEPDLCIDANQIAVTGTVTGDTGIAGVTVNGTDAILDPAGGLGVLSASYAATIPLVKGENTIETIATDTSGKTGTDTRKIYNNSASPVLNWTPAEGTITTAFSVVVEGTVSDDVAINSVTVNGESVTLTGTGNAGEYFFSKNLPLVFGANTITVVASDSSPCGKTTQVRQITVVDNSPPVADAGGPYSVNEGSSIALDAAGSFDPDSDPLIYEWDLNNDGTYETGGVTPDFSGIDGPFLQTVGLKVTDSGGLSSTASATVTIVNVAPVVASAIISPVGPIHVNTEISASADFSDPGVLDTHAVEWSWGDGSSSTGSVTEKGGTGTVTGSHRYASPGVYTISCTVTDKDAAANACGNPTYAIIFDPTAGFVTGGGFIDSPAGAFTENPSLTGKANFGFVVKYKKGAATPTGKTGFQFHAGDFDFRSTNYQWLIIGDAKAQYKGVGTINGSGSYDFILTATDGNLNGSGSDKLRIQITSGKEGIIYDNQPGAGINDDPVTVSQGQIVIISGK